MHTTPAQFKIYLGLYSSISLYKKKNVDKYDEYVVYKRISLLDNCSSVLNASFGNMNCFALLLEHGYQHLTNPSCCTTKNQERLQEKNVSTPITETTVIIIIRVLPLFNCW